MRGIGKWNMLKVQTRYCLFPEDIVNLAIFRSGIPTIAKLAYANVTSSGVDTILCVSITFMDLVPTFIHVNTHAEGRFKYLAFVFGTLTAYVHFGLNDGIKVEIVGVPECALSFAGWVVGITRVCVRLPTVLPSCSVWLGTAELRTERKLSTLKFRCPVGPDISLAFVLIQAPECAMAAINERQMRCPVHCVPAHEVQSARHKPQ